MSNTFIISQQGLIEHREYETNLLMIVKGEKKLHYRDWEKIGQFINLRQDGYRDTRVEIINFWNGFQVIEMENIDEYFQVFRLCLNIDIPKRWIGFDINVKETHYFRSARDILNSLISLSSYGRYGVKTNNTCIHIIISYYEVPQKITPEDIRTFIENAIFNKIIKII